MDWRTNAKFFIVDKDGLITKGRHNLEEREEQAVDILSFAAGDTDMDEVSLLETVRMVKPNILIYLSPLEGLFT